MLTSRSCPAAARIGPEQATKAGRRTIKIQEYLEVQVGAADGEPHWKRVFAVIEGGYIHYFANVRARRCTCAFDAVADTSSGVARAASTHSCTQEQQTVVDKSVPKCRLRGCQVAVRPPPSRRRRRTPHGVDADGRR